MYHDALWRNSSLQSPQIWPVWETIRQYCTGRILEIGSGNLPKVPVKGSYFIEKSTAAVDKLNDAGGHAFLFTNNKLPFKSSFFSLVAAFEVLEHIKEDLKIVLEVKRVLRKGGIFILSVPINSKYWTKWDICGGHFRRYNPSKLVAMLSQSGFKLEKYSVAGFSSAINRSTILGNYINPFLIRFSFLSSLRSHFILPIVNGLEKLISPRWMSSGFAFNTRDATNVTMILEKK